MDDLNTDIIFVLNSDEADEDSTVLTSGCINILRERKRRKSELCNDAVFMYGKNAPAEKLQGCRELQDVSDTLLNTMKKAVEYALESENQGRTVFVICGDQGLRTHIDRGDISTLIKRGEKEHNWEFMFIARDFSLHTLLKELKISNLAYIRHGGGRNSTRTALSLMKNMLAAEV